MRRSCFVVVSSSYFCYLNNILSILYVVERGNARVTPLLTFQCFPVRMINRASLNARKVWNIRKLLYKEAINVGEETVCHGLIIEIVPGCELVDLNIHARNDV